MGQPDLNKGQVCPLIFLYAALKKKLLNIFPPCTILVQSPKVWSKREMQENQQNLWLIQPYELFKSIKDVGYMTASVSHRKVWK